MAGNATAESARTKSTSKAFDYATRLKIPFALLVLMSCGVCVYFKHRKMETQAWEEIHKLKAKLVEASETRKQVAKYDKKVSHMLKDLRHFREILDKDKKELGVSKKTISSMKEKFGLFQKQLQECPEEIQGNLKTLESKVVASEDQANFEQTYMPSMWKTTKDIRKRLESAAPEDMASLRKQLDKLHDILKATPSKISKVDKSELKFREERIEELKDEIKRLGGDPEDSSASAFVSLSQKHVSAEQPKGNRIVKLKALANSDHKPDVKVEPLKCMQQ